MATKKELEQENKLLKDRLDNLEKLLLNQQSPTVSKSEEIEDEPYEEIPMHKPIKVMSLYDGGLNLKRSNDDSTPFRFNFFGDTQPIFYSDLVNCINTQRRFFEEGFCVILDKKVIKAHYLEKYTEKFLDKKVIDEILTYEDDKISALYKNTTKQIQQTIVDLTLSKLAKNEYVDMNKVKTLGNLYGKDLYELAEHLK